GLEGDIDGLVHLSDIIEGDGEATKEALEAYKKGDEINCLIFGIDAERERISLKLSD
ncbi:MAG: S1 RNA-binding domain-containing protein, partial [Proteobacteria bacterium]|nr:S1 RNA-binding domain-containing protein [Pseudomonadota bacterium]